MESTIFMNIKKLYEFELYSNVIPLASLLHTAFENDRTLLTPEQEYQLLLFEANSYYYERKFRKSESYFRQAIQTKKSISKQKNSFPITIENIPELSDSEIRYRLAVCLDEIQQRKDAIVVLQSIANKQRTPKMNMLLAKLLHYSGNENGATISYKDVLRECPLNLEAIRSLLELGVNGIEVNSLLVNISYSPQCSDWLCNWIKGHDHIYSQKFTQAIEAFKTINQSSKIRNNELLLVLIGECLYYNGNYDASLRYLSQAHMKKPNLTDGLMQLAVMYFKKNKLQELEKLTTPSLMITEFETENWFVLAQSLFASNKYEKAAYFAQKAIYQNPRNTEAYLLKVKIFFELKKYREALDCLQTVRTLAPYRFEVYKGLVDCYLITNRLRDAQTMAAYAVRTIGQNSRTLVLLSRTFLKDPMLKKKVKSCLTKALDLDEYYFPAVALMVEILQGEGDIAGALKLLKKQVIAHPNCKLHSILGDILSTEKDLDGALENYTIALNLDPTNMRALAGLNAMGHSSRPNTKQDESSYTASSVTEEPPIDFQEHAFEMVEISPPLAGEVESESETLWSDVEVEVHHS